MMMEPKTLQDVGKSTNSQDEIIVNQITEPFPLVGIGNTDIFHLNNTASRKT